MKHSLTLPLPWHNEAWNFILDNAEQNKLAHAILLTGAQGLGKKLFIDALVRTLLCQQGIQLKKPCEQCKACYLTLANTHPDLHYLLPEEVGKNIKIDAVRHLILRLQQTTQYNNYKIAVITPADELNSSAANALLKTLEEPTPRTIIFLLTSQPQFLSATIRSRCQIINFTAPTLENAKNWLQLQIPGQTNIDLLLQLAENMPLRALQLAQEDAFLLTTQIIKNLIALSLGQINPVQLAADWSKLSMPLLLNEMRYFLLDLIRLKSNVSLQCLRAIVHKEILIKIAQRISLIQLYGFFDKLNNAQIQYRATNLNQQLFLENLLYCWYEYTTK